MDMNGGHDGIILLNSDDFLEWFDSKVHKVLDKTGAKKAVDWVSRDFFNWAQRNSLYPLHFGIACCALESPMVAASPRYDMERFGILPRSTPRQCDLLIVNGPISMKLKDRIVTLYEQTAEPKWVLAMGECAISGGPFYESYNIIEGVDKLIPVDVYLPGCPPRPEAFLDAIFTLQEKIIKEKKGMFMTGV